MLIENDQSSTYSKTVSQKSTCRLECRLRYPGGAILNPNHYHCRLILLFLGFSETRSYSYPTNTNGSKSAFHRQENIFSNRRKRYPDWGILTPNPFPYGLTVQFPLFCKIKPSSIVRNTIDNKSSFHRQENVFLQIFNMQTWVGGGA